MSLELRDRFSCLAEGKAENGETLNNLEDDNVEECWRKVKVAYNETAKKVLGYRKRKIKFGLVRAVGKKLRKGGN